MREPGFGHRRSVIGFAKEMDSLERWLNDPVAGTELYSVSGIGGIGKTTLLMEMGRRSRAASVVTLWLDGRSELSTSGAMLSSLEMNLEGEYGRVRRPDMPLLPFIVSELMKQRTVLLVDNCEGIGRMEGWLLSSFLPKLLQSQVLLVFASRSGLPVKWRTSPYIGSRMRVFPLQLFTREEVHEYLRGSGLAEDVQRNVAQTTDGHPLLLALTVDWLRSREGQAPGAKNGIPAMLSAELLRETASPALYEALTVMSLLPEADQAMLNRLLDTSLDAVEYHALGQLSFVRMTSDGVVLHHVVARLLREDYAGRSPEAFQQLRRKVFELLAERFHTVDKRRQMGIAAHVLELYREYLPSAHAYANFSTTIKPGGHSLFLPEDLPYLHSFLAASVHDSDWQSELAKAEEYHSLLEDIAVHSPEGICVVRDEAGIPLAFCAGVWLHASTLPLLEQYAPGFIAVLGEETEQLYRLPPESADTICILLAAVDASHVLYRPEELGGLLMQQWLIRMTGGLRGMLVTADPQLNGLLPVLGFERSGSISVEGQESYSLTKWVLDFRQTKFDEWVQRVILQTVHPTDASPASLRSNEAKVTIEADEMKYILRHLFDESMLEQLPAGRRLGESGAEIRRKVQAVLTADPPPYPLTALEQQLLRESYIRKDRNKSQLAEAFHMSRTTFYRHSLTAIAHLAYVLTEQCDVD